MLHGMASRRKRRKDEKERRQAATARVASAPDRDAPILSRTWPTDRVERLTYTRRQAAEALGVSVSTIDRRVVPAVNTVRNEWGMRLIPVVELERYLAERAQLARSAVRPPRQSGRKPGLSAEVAGRIRQEHAAGRSLGEIARGLNADRVATSQGGRQWWPSTVRTILARIGEL
jgi:hypothetical protein